MWILEHEIDMGIFASNRTQDISVYSGRQPSYRDNWNCTAVKSSRTSFRSILTHYFLDKYIVWPHIYISLLSSMFSSTFLKACTISVVPVRWLSSSVDTFKYQFTVYFISPPVPPPCCLQIMNNPLHFEEGLCSKVIWTSFVDNLLNNLFCV